MKIDRMNKGEWGKVRAFFDVITDDGFTIKGFKLVEGIKGLFVGFPSEKRDDEYHDTVWADKETKSKLQHMVTAFYGGDEGVEYHDEELPVVQIDDDLDDDLPF